MPRRGYLSVNPVDKVTVKDVCMLLLRSHLSFGVVWGVVLLYGMRKKRLIIRISTCVNQNILVACVRGKTCLYKRSYTRLCNFARGRLMTRLTRRPFHCTQCSNYVSHFIRSYLVENTEYPELLANGGKILQVYINACESTFIDSFCFLSMSLSKFIETFNLPDVVKGTFPQCFNTQTITGTLACYQLGTITKPTVLKKPLVLNLIQWHGGHSNDEFIFDREIHEYCTADVALLKYGCMKFTVLFIADTGIDSFRNCTIVGACMHVFRTSHLKEKTIARVPPTGYRSMQNYSNKSM